MSTSVVCLIPSVGPIYFNGIESGGGGDCMFHSIARCLGRTMIEMRAAAASMVTRDNVVDVITDMVCQLPKNLTDKMDIMQSIGETHRIVDIWNSSNGDLDRMVEGMQNLIKAPGSIWGDATMAALIERALNVNIILLARHIVVETNKDTWAPKSAEEILSVQDLYSHWVHDFIVKNPSFKTVNSKLTMMKLAEGGYTIESAGRMLSSRIYTETPIVTGRRYPIGSFRMLVSSTATAAGGAPTPLPTNYSSMEYDRNRDTIAIINCGNSHWVCGHAISTITPTIPNKTGIRRAIDKIIITQ